MNPSIILITVVAYFILLFGISWFAGRKADNQGFFVGNRKSKWGIVAIATMGSFISGVTFVSVPGMVGVKNFSYLQMVMGFVVGQFIIAFVLVPLFYRMHLVSVYQYLENRFGIKSYKTGAWFFFISKMLGASVRLFLVCLTLQLLVFEPLHLPFILNVVLTVFLVWLYTFRGGVKSIIWTDVLKSLCLILSVALSIYFIANQLDMNFTQMIKSISDSDMSQVFFFDDANDKRFFWKQFLAGVFTMIATTGLDQDMMQRNLSCQNYRDSQKNMMVSIVAQFFINLLFLMLGVLLYEFAARVGIDATGDSLFPAVATSSFLPLIVGILFIVGLFSSAYSAAGSALTALTTSFTIDILAADKKIEAGNVDNYVARVRKHVHIAMAILMGIVIFVFGLFNNSSVVDAVYVLASYTYGPILGLFAFGILMKKKVRDHYVPLVAILSPILCFILSSNSETLFGGYQFSYELLIFNALFTFLGLCMLIKK
ncbi:MAG: sodium:solute symporter [Prevotella sp.]|jgi:Na+/proline symporter|nr:sodium:solute symporter [Prevotella sp.]MEE3417166.1 sodium:solute symporter [Prevotella sp.]